MALPHYPLDEIRRMIARTAHTPEEISSLLQLLATTAWEPYLEEARRERAEAEARVMALVNRPLPCSRCGRVLPGSQLDRLPGFPGSHRCCPSCAEKIRAAYTRVCALCSRSYIVSNRTEITIGLCSACWTPELAREARRVYNQLMRARAAHLPATLTLAQWLATIDHFEQCCAYCPAPFTELDHFIPLVHGGETSWGNCLPICQSCNQKKGKAHPDDPDLRDRFPAGTFERIVAYFLTLAHSSEQRA